MISDNKLLSYYITKNRIFFDCQPVKRNWLQRQYRAALAHYYRLIIPADASVLEIGCADAGLLELLPNKKKDGVDISAVKLAEARRKLPESTFYQEAGELFQCARQYDYIILSDTVNYAADLQKLFENLQSVCTADTRLIVNFYNTLYRPLISFMSAMRVIPQEPQASWLSTDDVRNLLALSNWECLKEQPRLLLPLNPPLIGTLLNRFLAPVLSFFCMTIFLTARSRVNSINPVPSVSVVIPARNEAGNIENAIQRIPKMGKATEIIFVEGHSLDNTWEEIQRVVSKYGSSSDFILKAIRQSGKGKGNAVREGFGIATGDILMILDADLTMPPEELPKFYEAIRSGKSEFANGVRLVYPMEKQAMRFLNMCANKFFSIAFTWILGQPIKDTLCGTKVLSRKHYEQITRNRTYFGDFDPFGDFDLIFGAAKLNLKFADIPIRYQDRVYGSTNISRWKHGVMLLRMMIFAAFKLKFI